VTSLQCPESSVGLLRRRRRPVAPGPAFGWDHGCRPERSLVYEKGRAQIAMTHWFSLVDSMGFFYPEFFGLRLQ
jgi:hypothetical protein